MFGHCLHRYRRAAGLSQAKLAAASGMSVRALRDLENGRAAAPQERSAGLLATALGLDEHETTSFLLLAKDGRRRSGRGEHRALLYTLPAVSRLAGRQDELRWLASGAGDGGVVAVWGAPGTGKTALAVTAAHQLSRWFPDGCLAIDLHGTDDRPTAPHSALERLLTWLGVPGDRVPRSEDGRAALYRTMLRDRRVLVVLDDARDESQVEPLLSDSGRSLVLVTSRRLLSKVSARQLPLDVLSKQAAADLVASIAGEDVVRQDPEGTEELVSLCGRLPLALRIVGNRLASWREPVSHLAGQLRDERLRLDTLSVGDLAVRPAFEVSFRQLTPRARRVFRRLSLIPEADFGSDLAVAAAGLPPGEVAGALCELVEMSLLSVGPSPTRLRFHDLVRLFARERFLADEPERTRERLRDSFHSHELMTAGVRRRSPRVSRAEDRVARTSATETEADDE
ncbi:Helix-turn-helix domain-containing protein [Lentzea fradiae]|uniref:Helix-turn-helix domain-containing protein n=1 Tax=Lentzea fradiae TaxID=200378 RepID=A0A1G7UPF2_9PSEU|nr:Helix-turn-helix domain-containing protein [Lentzea fradiae]